MLRIGKTAVALKHQSQFNGELVLIIFNLVLIRFIVTLNAFRERCPSA